MKRLLSAVVLAAVLAPAMAFAQTTVQEPDKTVYRHKTIIDVGEGSELLGTGQRPTVAELLVPAPPKFKSLISLRGSFQRELMDSTENLH